MTWIVEVLDARVQEELDALPGDMKARFRRIVELIQTYGLETVHEPHVKHVEGRYFPGDIRYVEAEAGCGGACVH